MCVSFYSYFTKLIFLLMKAHCDMQNSIPVPVRVPVRIPVLEMVRSELRKRSDKSGSCVQEMRSARRRRAPDVRSLVSRNYSSLSTGRLCYQLSGMVL
jgi:hypothetical protein